MRAVEKTAHRASTDTGRVIRWEPHSVQDYKSVINWGF